MRVTYLSEGWGLPPGLCVLSIAPEELPPPKVTRGRERGYVLFRCLVCSQQTTSSAIWNTQADTYDGGTHCGQQRVAIEWHPLPPEPA